MHLTTLDNLLWAAGFLFNAALFTILLLRGRWRNFPVFTLLAGFEAAFSITLYAIYSTQNQPLYSIVYWAYVTLDFGLQIALIFEMARIVLRPTGTWVQDARSSFLLWGFLGAILAAALAYTVHPYATHSAQAWEIRGGLFTSLLTCELFLAMMLAATRLGLVWRNHVMSLARGLTAWSIGAVVIDTLHSLLGHQRYFAQLEHAKMFIYLATLLYWMIAFWQQEPERQPLSEEMRKYLVALHARVEYDLAKVSSARNTR